MGLADAQNVTKKQRGKYGIMKKGQTSKEHQHSSPKEAESRKEWEVANVCSQGSLPLQDTHSARPCEQPAGEPRGNENGGEPRKGRGVTAQQEKYFSGQNL